MFLKGSKVKYFLWVHNRVNSICYLVRIVLQLQFWPFQTLKIFTVGQILCSLGSNINAFRGQFKWAVSFFFYIWIISPVGIGIRGKMFKKWILTSKDPSKLYLIFFRIDILFQLGVPDMQFLFHFIVPDNQIFLRFGVPNNHILLHFGVPDNCSMNISSQPWLDH